MSAVTNRALPDYAEAIETNTVRTIQALHDTSKTLIESFVPKFPNPEEQQEKIASLERALDAVLVARHATLTPYGGVYGKELEVTDALTRMEATYKTLKLTPPDKDAVLHAIDEALGLPPEKAPPSRIETRGIMGSGAVMTVSEMKERGLIK